MEFGILLPCGETLCIKLKSKELKGKFLIDRVYESAKLTEGSGQYFGLRYGDRDNTGMSWLSPEDNLRTLSYLAARGRASIQLLVRIFPKNPDLVFSTAEARRIFRQNMKNMLVNDEIGCDTKTHALLDAYILQAESGDYIETRNYIKYMNQFEVYAPTSLGAGTPITETEYSKIVRTYHKQLRGTRPAQADIMFLSLVQKLPLYGCTIYSVSDNIHNDYFLALSENGIHFIYESFIEKFSAPKKTEILSWGDLVFSEVERNKVKLGFFPQGGEFVQRKIKIRSKYSQKGAYRFQTDINKHKELFLTVVDGRDVFDSRKEAERCYTEKIPRKDTSVNKRLHSLRNSLRNSLQRNKGRHHSNKENERFVQTQQDKRRVHSE